MSIPWGILVELVGLSVCFTCGIVAESLSAGKGPVPCRKFSEGYHVWLCGETEMRQSAPPTHKIQQKAKYL